MRKAKLEVAEARVREWVERNETVQEGLAAFVDLSRYQARIKAYQKLKHALADLDVRMEARADGGVADRGERLRMRVALQEVARSIISDRSQARSTSAVLSRLLSKGKIPPPLSDFTSSSRSCNRNWSTVEAPADALARMHLLQAQVDEDLVRARRFPRLVFEAGMSNLLSPSLGVKLDSEDLLGLGRQKNIAAAEAAAKSVLASYQQQKKDTVADLGHLEESFLGARADVVKLRSLVAANQETMLLFHDQLQAGVVPITEGISILQESTEVTLALIDAQASVLANCIKSSALRGVLVLFGDEDA